MSEREQFEAWAPTRNFEVRRMSPGSHDDYASLATEFAWLAWQASRRAALEEAARIWDNDGVTPNLAGQAIARAIRALAASDSDGGKDE